MTVDTALAELQARANTAKAAEMAAYHKVARAYLGVSVPEIGELSDRWRAELALEDRLALAAGLWQTNIPSRFLDELPPAHVEVTESRGGFGDYGVRGFGPSRFDPDKAFGSSYGTPGWQRAQRRGEFGDGAQADYADDESSPRPLRGRSAREARREGGNFQRNARRRHGPLTIEGELVAKSTGTASPFAPGDRVFHVKFGNGNVVAVDGNKLTIQFDKAGQKRVVDSFVERV